MTILDIKPQISGETKTTKTTEPVASNTRLWRAVIVAGGQTSADQRLQASARFQKSMGKWVVIHEKIYFFGGTHVLGNLHIMKNHGVMMRYSSYSKDQSNR